MCSAQPSPKVVFLSHLEIQWLLGGQQNMTTCGPTDIATWAYGDKIDLCILPWSLEAHLPNPWFSYNPVMHVTNEHCCWYHYESNNSIPGYALKRIGPEPPLVSIGEWSFAILFRLFTVLILEIDFLYFALRSFCWRVKFTKVLWDSSRLIYKQGGFLPDIGTGIHRTSI